VAYKVAPLTYFIAKQLGVVKVDRYSLPNILAGRTIVPELMQGDCTPSRIAQTWESLHINVQKERQESGTVQLIEQFTAIHHSLQQGGAPRAADVFLSLLNR
jgi:lipid-A-disaccharide synthase